MFKNNNYPQYCFLDLHGLKSLVSCENKNSTSRHANEMWVLYPVEYGSVHPHLSLLSTLRYHELMFPYCELRGLNLFPTLILPVA